MEEPFKYTDIPSMLKETFKEWNGDDPFGKAASVAYYAVFSLPGLLWIIVTLTGIFLDEETITGAIHSQISNLIGPDAASSVQNMLLKSKTEDEPLWATVIGIGSLLFGASGLFFQLQKILNAIWDVQKKENLGILTLLRDRVTSLGIVLVIGFLLLMSLVISAAISAVSDWVTQYFSERLAILSIVANIILSLGVVALLFATIFKVLPDVKIKWRMVWVGATITSVLFTIGKTLIGYYLSMANPASNFGTSGAIILILLWVSYSCLILFFGAEFTKVFGRRYGYAIRPSSHATHTASYLMEQQETKDTPSA